jgi:hypothetical protein
VTEAWNPNLMWWITAVELPALAGLFWLIWRARRELEAAVDGLREGLAAYKLEVAKSYASIAYLNDVERRLTNHLVRIENKLDAVTRLAVGERA